MEELKPCPFCGSKNIKIHDQPDRFFGQMFYIRCGKGHVFMFDGDIDDLKKAWNRRSHDHK